MAYAFDLKQVCGGYAYFSTFTHYKAETGNRYEIRQPSLVDVDRFSNALSELGQPMQRIDSAKSCRAWLYLHGWAIVDVDFARSHMPHWLKHRTCIRSPLGSFTDIEIASPRVLARSYRGRPKFDIVERDGRACLVCGATETLTLQHVLPFSAGGETSSRNMITLCDRCNQDYGDEVCHDLFRLAGLPHNHEPSLLKLAPQGEKTFFRAVYLSNNLMHTRCDVW